ncbi:MAG TPA: OmpA family protein [Fontimonas sp.]
MSRIGSSFGSRFGTSVAAAALAFVATSALADSAPPNYVSVMGSYVFVDDVRGTDDGPGYHLIYGSPMTEHFGLELNALFHESDIPNSNDSNYTWAGGLDLRYLAGKPRMGAFVLGGIGTMWEDFVGEEEISPYANVGLGVQFGSDRVQMRAEGRYYAIFNDDVYPDDSVVYDTRVNLGLNFAFGDDEVGDSDGDGVADDMDACPNTPLGVAVDPRGCPLVVAVSDSDGDGVPDSLDRCPGTPLGTVVDANGCPVDEDGDGVPNHLDKCPRTPPGFKVDANGCVVEEQTVIVLKSVHFAFDSSELTNEARVLLGRVIEGLRNQESLRLAIAGHTDSLGTEAYNQALSMRRADSVRAYLVSQGIHPSRLLSEGFGELRPIETNDTEEGRATNRRVEFRVLKN